MYKKGEFIPFTGDQSSIAANLDAAYGQLADVRRALDELPVTMRWVQRSGVEYLSVKETSIDNGTTKGARGVETERILNEFTERKAELKARVASLARVVAERASQLLRGSDWGFNLLREGFAPHMNAAMRADADARRARFIEYQKTAGFWLRVGNLYNILDLKAETADAWTKAQRISGDKGVLKDIEALQSRNHPG